MFIPSVIGADVSTVARAVDVTESKYRKIVTFNMNALALTSDFQWKIVEGLYICA